MQTFTEENYLKSIYHLSGENDADVSTKAIAELLDTAPPSVSDMLKKLADKDLIHYKKYRGVRLSEAGKIIALGIIRKHRLWEVFLVDRLGYKWDEVHEIAEQLEHIHSDDMIDRLDDFLGNPKHDPHGDPIPDKNGKIIPQKAETLSDLGIGEKGRIVGVKEHSATFLQYLEKNELLLGVELTVENIFEYDHSMEIKVSGNSRILSQQVSNNLLIQT